MFFGLFEVAFFAIFGLIFIMIVVQVVRGVKEWHSNNQSPVLDVEAAVVAKRQNTSVSNHNDGNGMMHTSTSTFYYVTFQFHSNDRQEFRVSGQQYGQLVEGDVGKLTFQGTRFLGFERQR
jgi:hypothetical protein